MEAKAMSFLASHPSILQIMDAFEDSDSCSIILELCQPHTLLERIAAESPLPESHATSLLKQLLEAVAHYHALGLASRDIKSDNLLFDEGNKLKLSNLGSVEWFDDESIMSGVVGMPYYEETRVFAEEIWEKEERSESLEDFWI